MRSPDSRTSRFARFASLFGALALLLAASAWRPLPAQDPDQPGQPGQAQPQPQPPTDLDRLNARLATRELSIDGNNLTLETLIAMVRDGADVPIVQTPEFLEAFDLDTHVAIRAPKITAHELLDLLSRMIGFTWTARGDVMMLCTRDETAASEDRVVVVHEVSSITARAYDYAAPRVGPGMVSGGGGPVWEDNEMTVEPIEVDVLQDLIQENIAPDMWGDLDTIQTVAGTLVVRAPSGVQRQITDFLDDLRQRRISVRITATDWQITTAAWHRLTAGSPTSLNADQVAALAALPASDARMVARRFVTARNRQRINLAETAPFEWRGLSREGGKSEWVRGMSGTVLDVRPVVSIDTDRILMDVEYTTALLDGMEGAGAIDLPRMRYRDLRSHVAIREGEALVLGGGLVPDATLPDAAADGAAGPVLTLISARRVVPSSKPAAPRRSDTRLDAVMADLAEKKLSVNFDDVPLIDAIAYVAERAEVGYVVSPEVWHDAEDVTFSLNVRDMPVLKLLRIISDLADVTIAPTSTGLLMITYPDELSGMLDRQVRLFDVSDLIFSPRSYASPATTLGVSPGTDSDILIADDNEPQCVFIDDLPDIIAQAVDPETWDYDMNVIAVAPDGQLVARNTAHTLRAVDAFLSDLRLNQQRMITVEWEVWDVSDTALFMKLTDAPADADARAVLAGADATAARCRRAGVVTMTDGQRVPVIDGAYVAHATAASDGDEGVLQSAAFTLVGQAMDFRPVFAAGDDSIDLHVRATLQVMAGKLVQQLNVRQTVHLHANRWGLAAGTNQPLNGSPARGVLLVRASPGK